MIIFKYFPAATAVTLGATSISAVSPVAFHTSADFFLLQQVRQLQDKKPEGEQKGPLDTVPTKENRTSGTKRGQFRVVKCLDALDDAKDDVNTDLVGVEDDDPDIDLFQSIALGVPEVFFVSLLCYCVVFPNVIFF